MMVMEFAFEVLEHFPGANKALCSRSLKAVPTAARKGILFEEEIL